MGLSVRERGETVATLRWIHVRLMEMLAGWTPTTPEMEAKLLFGSHIWDMAQHADLLGKRTYELRMPLQHSLWPTADYVALLDGIRLIEDTNARIAAFYDGILPALAERLANYLSHTDRLIDAPSVRIIERIASDQQRMIGESQTLRGDLPKLSGSGDAATQFLADEAKIVDFVTRRAEAA